ncbi:hypothetical protein BRC65_07710 [Halobacteriales archaeon QH_2_65_14]|nr:MAG: hypothetical protein BRC65_07710 [Halobacteriales archaeon QH_2_65_14]
MFAVAVTLLVVWGLLDMALTVLRVVSVSFPLLMRTLVTLDCCSLPTSRPTCWANSSSSSARTPTASPYQKEIALRMEHIGFVLM